MSDILVDTNILIYSINKDSDFYIKANTFLLNTENVLYTTSKNITEFLSVVTRIPDYKISIDKAYSIIDDFLNFIKILYPNPKSTDILKSLLLKYKPSGLQIHDYEIVSIGLSHNIKDILTINKNDFKNIKEIDVITI